MGGVCVDGGTASSRVSGDFPEPHWPRPKACQAFPRGGKLPLCPLEEASHRKLRAGGDRAGPVPLWFLECQAQFGGLCSGETSGSLPRGRARPGKVGTDRAGIPRATQGALPWGCSLASAPSLWPPVWGSWAPGASTQPLCQVLLTV